MWLLKVSFLITQLHEARFSREVKPIGYMKKYVTDLLQELASMVMDPKKSQVLLPVLLRTRKQEGIIQSYSTSLRTRGSLVLSPRYREAKNQKLWYERVSQFRNLTHALPFCPFSSQWVGWWGESFPIGEGNLFTQSTDSNADLFQKHLHRHT